MVCAGRANDRRGGQESGIWEQGLRNRHVDPFASSLSSSLR